MAMLVVLAVALAIGCGVGSSGSPTVAQRAAAIEADIKCPSCDDINVAQSEASTAIGVRRDLKAPRLPFVVGQMGVGGANPEAGVKTFKAAQAAVLEVAEFKGNVALVKTDGFWDTEAEAVFKKGWREHLDEWNKVGSDYPYHYLGSARTMCRIGRAFGEAVLALRGEK